MRNVAVLEWQRMQIHSDRFETVLPKGRFFTPPVRPPKLSPKIPGWVPFLLGGCLLGVLLGGLLPVVTNKGVPPDPLKELQAAPTPIPTPAPAPLPIPTHRLPTPVPATPLDAPRASLVHVRPIGSIERNVMPDGRVLTTRYMGELPNTGHLPTRGGQLGDEWFTRADQHCWVLAPVTTGSQTIGWVDP